MCFHIQKFLKHLARFSRLKIISLTICIFSLWGQPTYAQEITIFAPSSMKDTLDAIAYRWEQDNKTEVTISYAGSPRIAHHIRQGAPADIIITANPEWMDWLEAQSLIEKTTRRNIISNQLVLIAHKSAPDVTLDSLVDILNDSAQKIALANIETVPAGIYAKESLSNLSIWNAIEPLVVQSSNVRQALNFVNRGETPYAIVYASDATHLENGRTLEYIPRDLHKRIYYPAAVTAHSEIKNIAQKFIDDLLDKPAQDIFIAHNFAPLQNNFQQDLP